MRILLTLACLLAPALATAETLTLRADQPTGLPGSDLSLQLADVQDGRCPAGTDCYWIGTIRVDIMVTAAKAPPVTITLCNLCDGATSSARVADLDITLVDLAPSKEYLFTLDRDATLADYSVTVTVAP